MITTMTEKNFYTQEDLLTAISKLPEKEAENILENYKLSTMLTFINYGSEEQREQLQNNLSEYLHKQQNIYNGFDRLYDMLPVIDCKYYSVEQSDGNGCEETENEEK